MSTARSRNRPRAREGAKTFEKSSLILTPQTSNSPETTILCAAAHKSMAWLPGFRRPGHIGCGSMQQAWCRGAIAARGPGHPETRLGHGLEHHEPSTAETDIPHGPTSQGSSLTTRAPPRPVGLGRVPECTARILGPRPRDDDQCRNRAGWNLLRDVLPAVDAQLLAFNQLLTPGTQRRRAVRARSSPRGQASPAYGRNACGVCETRCMTGLSAVETSSCPTCGKLNLCLFQLKKLYGSTAR